MRFKSALVIVVALAVLITILSDFSSTAPADDEVSLLLAPLTETIGDDIAEKKKFGPITWIPVHRADRCPLSTILVNAFHFAYLAATLANIDATYSHCTGPLERVEIVLLVRDPRTCTESGISSVSSMVDRSGYRWGNLTLVGSRVTLFYAPQAPLVSPSMHPLLSALQFLRQVHDDKKARHRHGMFLYLDAVEVEWLGDVFTAIPRNNLEHKTVYLHHGSWGMYRTTPLPAPYVIGSSLAPLLYFLTKLECAFTYGRQEFDEMSLLQYLVHFSSASMSDEIAIANFDEKIILEANYHECHAYQRNTLSERFGTSILLLVDKHRCFMPLNETHSNFGSFCPSIFSKEYYTVPRTGHETRMKQLRLAKPRVMRILDTLKAEEVGAGQTINPSNPIFDTRGSRDYAKYAACPGGKPSAVLATAGGYKMHQVHSFMETFLAVADLTCTELIIFVNGTSGALKTMKNGRYAKIHFVESLQRYPIQRTPQKCKWADTRFEVYQYWLDDAGLDKYTMVAFTDVRDVIFQADPFASLVQSHVWRTYIAPSYPPKGEEFIYIPMESFSSISSNKWTNWPLYLFREWLEHGFGQVYRKGLQKMFLDPDTREGLPVLCSGLFLGSSSHAPHGARHLLPRSRHGLQY